MRDIFKNKNLKKILHIIDICSFYYIKEICNIWFNTLSGLAYLMKINILLIMYGFLNLKRTFFKIKYILNHEKNDFKHQ